MLIKAFAALSRRGRKAAVRRTFGARARILGVVLLLCLFGLGASSLIPTPSAQEAFEPSTPNQQTGDSVIGKSLFTGSTRFQEGGPPCLACHSISGIGALGGGALGPNLTGTYGKLGDAMIVWPENVLPMRPIYLVKPLTPDEKTQLLAFFQSAAVTQRPTQAVFQLSGLAIVGTALALGIAHLIWRRRIKNVRQTMVERRTLPGS